MFFVVFLPNWEEKHLVIEWWSWLPDNSGFMNYNVLETSTNSCSTPPSLKIVQQRVHVFVGDALTPRPSTMLWGPKGLNQEGLNSPKSRRSTISSKAFNKFVQLTPPSRSILLLIHAPKKIRLMYIFRVDNLPCITDILGYGSK